MGSTDYYQQLNRAKRFLKRIEKPINNQTRCEDDLWSFFIHAQHVVDWICADLNYSEEKEGKFKHELITKYPNLAICNDIANRTKHVIHKNPSSYVAKHKSTSVTIHVPMQYVITNEVTLPNSNKKARSSYKYIIADKDGNEYEAIELARNIIKDWGEIIRSLQI